VRLDQSTTKEPLLAPLLIRRIKRKMDTEGAARKAMGAKSSSSPATTTKGRPEDFYRMRDESNFEKGRKEKDET